MQRKNTLSMIAALAACAGSVASVSADRAAPAGTQVLLTYAQFDPLHGTPWVPPTLQAGPGNELYLVQSFSAPVQSMQEQIGAAGGVVERYVADSTLVVRMTPEARAAVAALPFVRWVGAFHPAYRLDAQVLDFLTGAGDAPARFDIETMRSGPAQQHALKTLIEALGGTVNVMTPEQYRMEATLTPPQLLVVAQQNEVNSIFPWAGPMGVDMDIIRQLGGAVPILSGAGYTGQGVRGEIFDTGVIPNHQQWNGQPPLIHLGTVVDSHGNACYGVNFATGTGNAAATGMCPNREQGIFCWASTVTQFGGPTTRLAANTQAVDPLLQFRSCYQTSSVGNPQVTTYTPTSAETDDYLWRVDYLSCQSQSNTGNQLSRPQAWAKNMMAVGGINHNETLVKTDDTYPGSSVGYASDGRMKPELSHSYLNVFTTYSTLATGYGQFSGTSSATPITAGHFGLLTQMFHEGVWTGFGGGASVFADRPKSTTARALMIAGAFRYDWAAPSLVNGHVNATLLRNRQGWGMADVGCLYQMRDTTFIVNETDVLLALESKSYQIEVAAGEPRLNITMVYADPPGNPNVQTQHRINNLDLKVTAPNGAVYWGNWGLTQPTSPGGVHSNWSTASVLPATNPDTKNTCENVWVFQPAAGTWTVEVIASEVVADARLETPGVFDVDYGLAVVGGVEAGGCYPDCNQSGGLTIADFICFQAEYVAGNLAYADCNQSGNLTIADFICFQAEYVAGCP